MMINVQPLLTDDMRRFADLVNQMGGRAFVVGGTVRDILMGFPIHDVDLEITGISQADLEMVFPRFGFQVRLAGQRPGVFLISSGHVFHNGNMFEVALPQRRTRHSADRNDFSVEIDHTMDINESLLRRDVTVNAIAVEIGTNQVFDPTGGQADIRAGLLRAINADNFGTDPLRVFRVMRFASTHDLEPTASTIMSAWEHVDGFRFLSPDRVRSEWLKWAAGVSPSRGLRFLINCGWVRHFPIIAGMIGLEQDAIWHPEGDTMTHTCLALDEVRSADPAVVFAVLLHDTGKVSTTVVDDDTGRITSAGHADAGADLVVPFFRSIGVMGDADGLVPAVQALVRSHMWLASFQTAPSSRAIMRFSRSIAPATVRQWAQVCMADVRGRGDMMADVDHIVDVADRAAQVQVLDAAPAPIVMGRHLIEHNICQPGVQMGEVLRRCMDAQLDGRFDNLHHGLEFARFEMRMMRHEAADDAERRARQR